MTDELEVLRKLDKALHTIRYDGMRLLVLLYFLNQQLNGWTHTSWRSSDS